MTTEQLIAELRAQDPSGKGRVILFGKDQGFSWYCEVGRVTGSAPSQNEGAGYDPVIECGDVISVG